mgnify:CR=1 FL=1
MANVLIDICHNLDECLGKVRSLGNLTSFNAATGFIDYDGLLYVLNYLGSNSDVRVVVGDLGPIPRVIYERWRDVVRIYHELHTKLYLFGNGIAIVGSANLTSGGLYRNLELNIIIRNEELYEQLMGYYDELWRSAKPLTEDYVEDIEEVEAKMTKRGASWFVNEVNEALLNILGVHEECLTTFNPRQCAVTVAEAINREFRNCRDLPENCIVNTVAKELNLEVKELARELMGSPNSAIVAGHPLCWVKVFVNLLRVGHINVEELSSGVKIYESMVKETSQKCPGAAGELAREELGRLNDEDYRDNYIRWKISYRLLPLALVLPISECRLVGIHRRNGTVLRRLVCNQRGSS